MNKLLYILLFLPFAMQGQTLQLNNNLVKISADSAIRLNSNFVYVDQLCDVVTATAPVAAWTFENYCSTGVPMVFLRHDQDDYMVAKIQFNHNKALNQACADVHIHCVPMANQTANVRLCVYYKWINYGETLPTDTAVAAGTWTRTYVTLPITAAEQYKEGVCTILSNVSPPANETPSSILHVIIIRLGSSSTLDTYNTNKTCGGTNSANFGVVYIDAHYPVSKLGSRTNTTD